ncbi:MFS transporter [Microbacterium sp. X-17]|uniref:MFS transporter n=1 Tax=Microbacterium sp. X-17 TaxID=3144404 RepID=UPI0031F49800
MLNPYLTQPSGRRVATLIGVYATFFFVIGDAIGFSVLLPVALNELGGMQLYALATSIGGIAAVVAMPLLGFLAARFPHARPMMLGVSLLIVVATIALRGLAWDAEALVASTVLLSIGTSASYTIGLPLIRDMFPVHRAGTLLGAVSSVSSIGVIAGPIIIGIIIQSAGWRGVSIFSGAGLLVAALLVMFGARPSKKECAPFAVRVGSFDWLGAILLTAFITFLVLPLALGTSAIPYGSPLNTLYFAVSAVALIGFSIVTARRKAAAFIPTTVLKNRNSLALMFEVFFAAGSLLVAESFIPVYILNGLHGTAVEAGIAAALFGIPAIFLGPLVGRWIANTGTVRGVIWSSTAFKLIAMIGLGTWMLVAPETVNIWVVYAACFLAGIYNVGQQGTVMAAPQIMVPGALRPQATGAISTQIVFGPIAAAAVFGSVIVSKGPTLGVALALLTASIMAALGLIPPFFMRRLRGAEAEETLGAAEVATEEAGPAIVLPS